MNKEDTYETQLAEQRANDKKTKTTKKTIKKLLPPTLRTETDTNIAEWTIVLLAAFFADIPDILELTGVLLIIVKIIDFPVFLALLFWVIIKQQKIPNPKKDPIFMLFTAFAGELIPGLGVLPFWTTYIIYLWLRQTELGRKILARGVKKARAKKRKKT